ncbi:MAG: hypothetical protein ABSH53_11185 [Holophaga sp.]|jgi:3-isopropylmalate dehydratase small subunit
MPSLPPRSLYEKIIDRHTVRRLDGPGQVLLCIDRTVLNEYTSPQAEVDTLLTLAGNASTNRLTIDLPAQRIIPAQGAPVPFAIEARRKEALVRGLDAVAATLEEAEAIRSFERAYHQANPWLV